VNQDEKDFHLCSETTLVKTVSHHIHNLSQHAHVIASVEFIGDLHIFVDVRQYFL
jgi:hypothetical protein